MCLNLSNQRMANSQTRLKARLSITEPADKTVPNPKEVTVEDIQTYSPLKNQPLPPSSSKENVNSTPKSFPKTEKPQESLPITLINKRKSLKIQLKRKNLPVTILKLQSEKPFNLEAEIGKLKISIPLSELAKHDVYRQQIKSHCKCQRIGMM
jgi:hypothetical protein